MSLQAEKDQPADQATQSPEEAYRRQVIGLARALVEGRIDDIVPHLAGGFTADQVVLFVDGNYEKRVDLLLRLLDDMPQQLNGLENLAIDFVNEVPTYATDSSADEVDRFLRWILETQKLSEEDRDTITCHKARFGLERLARQKRAAHLAFQKLARTSHQRRGLLNVDTSVRIFFNPICIRARLLTKKYLEGGTPPAEVLFYASGPGNRASVLEPTALPRVEALAELESCTIDQWAAHVDPLARSEVVELAAGLVDVGVVAIDTGE